MALPSWIQPANIETSQVAIGGVRTHYTVWSTRDRPDVQRYYDPEFLPALFERTMMLDQSLPKDATLSWIFTGSHAGVTFELAAGSLNIVCRHYDTPAYYAINDKIDRHPEWVEKITTVRFAGDLKALSLSLDANLDLRVTLNGLPVFEKKWYDDLSQHQLKLSGVPEFHLRLSRPAAKDVVVTVQPSQTHQTMIGFGGVGSMPAYAQLSPDGKRRWWQYVVEYNLLIQREYPIGSRLLVNLSNWDALADATPHYYGMNFPNGEISDFHYNRLIRELGGQVWFEFWKLPPWVGDDMDKYASAIVGYCRTAERKAGAPPDIVGIQNEVSQPAERFHQMTLKLREALDAAGFRRVKIHLSNASQLAKGVQRARQFQQVPRVWATVDYAASNMYDYQDYFCRLDDFDSTMREWKQTIGDKPFLSTEICLNRGDFQWPSYRVAFTLGQLYHKNLTLTDAVAVIYCWTLLNVTEPSYGWSRTLFVVDRENGFVPVPSSHQLRVYGAYSRRIRAGMVRCEATANDRELLVTAFRGENGEATLVGLNRGSRPLTLNLQWPDAHFTALETADPYHPNIAEAYDPAKPLVINPGAIVTLTSVPLGHVSSSFLSEVDKPAISESSR